MKKILCTALIILTGCAGQAYQTATQTELNPSQVFDSQGNSKDKIYSSAKMWIAENFKSAKSVIEYDNPSDGVIIGNGRIPYPCEGMECMGKGLWMVDFTMKIEAKDNRFKTSFSNLTLELPMTTGTYSVAYTEKVPVSKSSDASRINLKLLNFGNEIKQYINRGSSSSSW